MNLGMEAAGLMGIYGTAIYFAGLLLNILFAIYLWTDARRNGEGKDGLLPPFAWALAGLVLGWIEVALYWAVHYSSLRKKSE